MAFTHSIEIRFSDLDAMGHVNNATMLSLVEQARYKWWQILLAGRPFQAEGFLLARTEIDYRTPILLGDEVLVELRCSRMGGSSFDLSFRVTRGPGGELFAEGKTVQVMLDFEAQRPKAVPAEVRAWLETQA